MSEIKNEVIEYIEQSKYALLITVGEKNIPYVRPIGPFSNNGLDIYFITSPDSQKVKQATINSAVTLYFQNEGQLNSYKSFKSVSLTGNISRVTDIKEFDGVVEALSRRSSYIKEWINKSDSAIYKVKTDFFIYSDNEKSPNRIEEKI